MTDMDPALVETVHALRAERDAARAEVARLRAAVEGWAERYHILGFDLFTILAAPTVEEKS